MADTDTETLPNGTGGALSTEEEDERLKQRPADIDADVREMERRKRVEALMSSKLFREELERVLDQQMHEGNDAPLLQRIREMVGGRLHTGSLRGPACVLPINDIRGIEGVGYEKGEKILRCKLAAVYRLVDLFGWTQTGISGQITARLNTAMEQVLTTPRGLLPHEVTASSLVKVDMQGVVQDQGTTNFPVNVEGFSLHASVHAARPDVRCVLHVRSPAALAVSAMKRGLLPLCTEAALLGDIAYHRLPNGILDNEERDKLVRALGPSAKVLVLTSGGALCCGATLEEAFHQARALTAACDVQLRLAALPLDQLCLLDDETRKQIYDSSRKPPADASKWRVGGEEFEALMRMLDNAGFRTGYIYRHPLIKNDVPKPKNDVEVPPAVSSLGYLLEEEELYKQGLWKKGHGKTGERTRWLNSPNVYQKVEVLETGTSDPKKITKWVDANNEEWIQDGSPAHSSTPVKIDTLQFVPKNTNPKEFKQLQQQIKENRRADKISAGPQSHILEGVTWDEASKLVGEDAANTHTGDHVVLMGAASKGIIQRGYQHNATVYSAPYARNPFDHVTDREIDEYRRTVERKQRGNEYDTDLSESEAISAAQITSPASAPSETEEESRDEHRVLRIETKQAPVRSQPEVVLSDDTVDFLNAERAHADRIKGKPAVARNTEALSSHKRSVHDYSRTNNFANIIKKYESPKISPKCKTSLNNRLKVSDDRNVDLGISSSRSSLYSIPSIEWDGRCRSEYTFKTRSLPRQRVCSANKLYRTRSHCGFVNSFVKDPAPTHYHLPRCYSCGASSNSWTSPKNRKIINNALYFSVDNLPQKCSDERKLDFNIVKVQETVVPVFKIAKVDTEFIESEEFNEEIYLGDIGNSFSSENQTVVEITSPVEDGNVTISGDNEYVASNIDVYRAECAVVDSVSGDENNNTAETIAGEYHSFSDEMDFEEAMYDSPVKDLVGKDIRDYSVPINLYCDDYAKRVDSPRESPSKRREMAKVNVLEPILEESKVSCDDSGNMCDKGRNLDLNTTQNKIEKADVAVELKIEIEAPSDLEVATELLEPDNAHEQEVCIVNDKESSITNDLKCITTDVVQTAVRTFDAEELYVKVTNHMSDIVNVIAAEASETIAIFNPNDNEDQVEIRTSIYSVSSNSDVVSFDSTAEFEKYEFISDLVTTIINGINFDATDDNDFFNAMYDFRPKDYAYDICSQDSFVEIDNKQQAEDVEFFSMKEIVADIETNVLYGLNETASTDNSESETTLNFKIAEAIVYYIFDAALFISTQKHRVKKNLNVVTIVEIEDILFTALPLWSNTETSIIDNGELIEMDYNNDVLVKNDVPLESIDTCDLPVQDEPIDSHTYPIIEKVCVKINSDKDTIISLEDLLINNDDRSNYELDYEREIDEEKAIDTILNETFVVDSDRDMNTAFVEEQCSRSSSPNGNRAFDTCFESPIKNTTSDFIGDDLSVLYEKEDTLLGSPFVKRAPIITMSQTEHTGGVKYWVSFDESLPADPPIPRGRKLQDKHSSFVCVDFDGNDRERGKRRKSLVHIDETNSNYTCQLSDTKLESMCTNYEDMSQKKLLYCARNGTSPRRHSSWPPFDHSVFYKIISQFRMSESFDPSDLETSKLDASF